MRIPIFQVDAFTCKVFRGNPAAVCPIDQWLPDALLQAIAAENNLSETAFFVGRDGSYEIRWFTPVCEVDLCGHATLATAHVIFGSEIGRTEIIFSSKSGILWVERSGDRIVLDFPAREAVPRPVPASLADALGHRPAEFLAARDCMAVFDSDDVVRSLRPDMGRLSSLEWHGVIVTAPGLDSDFVSRFFAPRVGIPEDPVTGAAHCTLVPYWARRLGKVRLHAYQVSSRGGEVMCEHRGERVRLAGHATTYLEGWIEVPFPGETRP